MFGTRRSRDRRSQAVFFCVALTIALTGTTQARGAAVQPGRAALAKKSTMSHLSAKPSKTTSTASRLHEITSTDRGLLLRLEGNQSDLEQQLRTLTEAAQRSTDELSRRMDNLSEK